MARENLHVHNLEMFQEFSVRWVQSSLSSNLKEAILAHLNALLKEITEDLKTLLTRMHIFCFNSVHSESRRRKWKQRKEEFIDLQASLIKQRYFAMPGYIKFCINEGKLAAPCLKRIAMEKVMVPFPTSYQAEEDLRLVAINIIPNIEQLAERLLAQDNDKMLNVLLPKSHRLCFVSFLFMKHF